MMWKCEAADDNMPRACCMLDRWSYTRARTGTYAPTHTHVRTQEQNTCTHLPINLHPLTHTRIEICDTLFPQLQWLLERASALRYTYNCTLYIVHWLSCLFCVDLSYRLLLYGIPGRVNVLFFVLERASCRGYQAVIQQQIKHSYFLFCLSWVRMSAATKPADLTIIDSIYLPSAERRCDMHCIR